MPRRSPYVTRPGWGRSAASVRKRERDRKRRAQAQQQPVEVILAAPTNLTVEIIDD